MVLGHATCQILPSSAIFCHLLYCCILSGTVSYCFLLLARLLLARLLLAPQRPLASYQPPIVFFSFFSLAQYSCMVAIYKLRFRSICTSPSQLEGKDRIVELEDKKQIKVTKFKLLGLLSFLLFLFYFTVFYIKRSINRKVERRYLISRKAL